MLCSSRNETPSKSHKKSGEINLDVENADFWPELATFWQG